MIVSISENWEVEAIPSEKIIDEDEFITKSGKSVENLLKERCRILCGQTVSLQQPSRNT